LLSNGFFKVSDEGAFLFKGKNWGSSTYTFFGLTTFTCTAQPMLNLVILHTYFLLINGSWVKKEMLPVGFGFKALL
jgi:hypothetical protein